jgi:hypothetical protein
MKRFYFILASFGVLAVLFGIGFQTSAQSDANQTNNTNLISPNLVISQFQVAGASANDEFIELHNISSTAVDLNGYRVVYRSAGGTNDVLFAEWTNSTIVPPGGYYLIGSTFYDGTVTPNFIYNPTTCSCSMSATGGGIAIRSGAVNTGTIVASVGYGTATNAFTETAVTSAPPANAGQFRLNSGCQDTDNNASDFLTLNPAAPRNASDPINTCGSSGSTLFIGFGANPNNVAPGATTLLTVTVFPATKPPSTGITVFGNLSNIGGAINQQFYDDGTNGDVTAGDNIFSCRATIPAGTDGGVYAVPVNASDAQMRAISGTINITVNGPVAGEDPLLLGNPSNATSDVANQNNYLMANRSIRFLIIAAARRQIG